VTPESVAVSAVVLTMGNRPDELRRCLDSLLAQTGVPVEVVVVGNGCDPAPLGPDVSVVALPQNAGVSAGRNAGVRAASGTLLFFFDDDAWLEAPDVLHRATRLFGRRPALGAIALRIVGTDGRTMRRWVPRARVGDPARSGPAFTLVEGVSMVRRSAFEQIGGWADMFFFAHEGVDLTWRLWDAGWEVHYAADLIARHPSTVPSRHENFFRFNARNRVLLVRRNLPVTAGAVYLAVWTAITMVRLLRHRRGMRAWWAGFAEGWRADPGRRRPMRWRTIVRLTRLGQPPII
jgi:GT2 family glycosyltransferase